MNEKEKHIGTRHRRAKQLRISNYELRENQLRISNYELRSTRTRFSSSPPLWGGFRRGLFSSSTAQFMQADNYIQSPEDYIGYNRYAYCLYNPFKYTDPSGEWLKSELDESSNYQSPGFAMLAQIQAQAQAMWNAYEQWQESGNKGSFFVAYFSPGGGGSPYKAVVTSGTNTGNVSGGSGTNDDGSASNEKKKTRKGKRDVSNKPDSPTPYKQKKLEKDENGNYIIPSKYSVVNTDNNGEPIYYKPESGEYDPSFFVDEGCYITEKVDGIATSHSDTKVYKIPDGGRVLVSDGIVFSMGGFIFEYMLVAQEFYFLFSNGTPYEWGWLNSQYFKKHNCYYGDSAWQPLFNMPRR